MSNWSRPMVPTKSSAWLNLWFAELDRLHQFYWLDRLDWFSSSPRMECSACCRDLYDSKLAQLGCPASCAAGRAISCAFCQQLHSRLFGQLGKEGVAYSR